ncbi:MULTISPECIES: TRAP transporter large permease [Marinobacter]|uniref:TRAP transporter large permease protein n=1 Tax=Marinobacter profundi TaxID=2666256 RepID=A0A2G1UJ58_9GAMM|nr:MULTISPECIES: TRAP transporter large permease [Marinobacter]MBD3657000.1 TRAP transporter large permease [Marinobacter sp.]PHQ14502.1 C4-dicarboxylate ABC transporter permease [Marinobacter profundi]
MEASLIGGWGFAAALALMIMRVPIAYVLVGVASVCSLIAYAWRPGGEFMFERGLRPAMALIESNAFDFIHSYSLSMIPLFIAAGHIAYHSRITTDIYEAVRVWLAKMPGGLAIASLFGCGGFSAITGSSLACASSMGRICVPEMLRFGYDKQLATSTVAMGGTLGSLIPPSVLFILYGMFTEQSVNKLFLAGVLPGILTIVGFIVVVMIWAMLKPDHAPAPKDLNFTNRDRLKAAIKGWPALTLMVIIIGGIYGGFFTATEAAAVCLLFAIGFGVLSRRLTWADFLSSMKETAFQSAALFFIAIGAKIFVSFVSLTGVTGAFVGFVDSLGLEPWMVLFFIVMLYIVLGMFLDSIGTMLLTLPFVIPLVEGMGMDLIWFGVVVVKLLEIGLVTPPLGMNVFVINSVVGKEIKVHTIFFGVMKFLVADLIVLGLIVAFPIISLLIPNSMG